MAAIVVLDCIEKNNGDERAKDHRRLVVYSLRSAGDAVWSALGQGLLPSV